MADVDDQWLVDTVNKRSASGELNASLKPYAEVRKSMSQNDMRTYGPYYLWDNSIDTLKAGDISLEHLARISDLLPVKKELRYA